MPPSRVIRTVATAFGAAAAAGAAQLGAGYGLGIFSWLPTVTRADESAWLSSLAWTVFICATSVVIGAVVGNRTLSEVGQAPARAMWRGTVALAATFGGLVVAALAAAPARTAQRADTFAPHVVVASYAIAGLLLGLVLAFIAVNFGAVGSNVMLTAGWLWLLAGVAAVDAYAASRRAGPVQLGMWQLSSNGPWWHGVYLPGAVMAAVSAFLIGAACAWPAARHGENRLWVALSGMAGPLIAAAGYLLAAPDIRAVNHELLPAHRVVPVAVVAGLLGSLPIGLLARARRGRAPSASAPTGSAGNDQTGSVTTTQAKVAGDAV